MICGVHVVSTFSSSIERSSLLFSPSLAISSSLYALPAPKTAPTGAVRMVQQWIPMPDGVRLSATLYMPDNA